MSATPILQTSSRKSRIHNFIKTPQITYYLRSVLRVTIPELYEKLWNAVIAKKPLMILDDSLIFEKLIIKIYIIDSLAL